MVPRISLGAQGEMVEQDWETGWRRRFRKELWTNDTQSPST